MQKVILFYKFTPLVDPEAIRLWQRNLAEQHGLKGRVLISEHGINGTLGGDLKSLKAYVKATKTYPAFKSIIFKWSEGQGPGFPKLVVKVRPEIVTFGAADELEIDEQGVVGGGRKLKPEQLHKLLEERGEDVVFFDGRNQHEATVGKFKNAVIPDVDFTRDFKAELEDPKYNDMKSKPVVTYCTGGIRCEVLSMLMKKRGFQEVYQLDGGIVKYGEKYGDDGLWEGSLYVFDDRMGLKFSDKAQDIANCAHCGAKTSNYENCDNKACNSLFLRCENCSQEMLCLDCKSSKVIV